ncbi:MAG: uracil-DNA glycosylase, partial [Spirochaetales bacterium]
VKRQIGIIKPKVILTLGKFASQTLLKTETPISALRGKFREYEGVKVMPTFHPAYLLRNPDDKKLVWSDMKKVMKEL